MQTAALYVRLRTAVPAFLACLLFNGTIFASLVSGNDSVYENSGLGYLTVPSLSPGHIVRPSSMFLLPNSVHKGSLEMSFDFQWANVWCYEPGKYMIDGEWIRSNTRIHYGLNDSVAIGFVVPVVGRTGGFSDSTIESFHRIFQLGNSQRDEFARNQCLTTGISNGTTQSFTRGESWGIGDVALCAVVKRPGTRVIPSLTLQFQLSLPTGDDEQLEGLGSPSISVSAVASKRLWSSPVIVFGGAGFFYCEDSELSGMKLHREEYSGLLGIEYEYTSSLSLVIQSLGSSAVAVDYYEFSKPCYELSFGAKWRISDSATVEFAVVENMVSFKNSSDIGMHLAVSRRL